MAKLSLYQTLAKAETIWRAWSVVLENGRTSQSRQTRTDVIEFAKNAPKLVPKIAWDLQHHRFKFAPARGIAIENKNKNKKRPIVLAPIPNRIVQRAILDVIQSIPSIEQILKQKNNFGGIEGAGVPEAIKEAYLASKKYSYFVRTDIKSFFVNVPRDTAVSKISKETNDEVFNKILNEATTIELANLNELGRDRELFPLEEIGVAQGSSLSPLICNLLLDEFDHKLNDRNIRCIRYIDDFLLFAPNQEKAFKALSSARRILKDLNKDLDCYDPLVNREKAEHGNSAEGFHFLGCEIKPKLIRPSKEAYKRLTERIDKIIFEALSKSGNPKDAIIQKNSYIDSLYMIGNVIRGWGNTYSFCNDDRLMKDLDQKIDLRLSEFKIKMAKVTNNFSAADKRRGLGVFLLQDCNKDEKFRLLLKS